MNREDILPAALVHDRAVELVLVERRRQVSEKGYTPEHDDERGHDELAIAASQMLLPEWTNVDIVHLEQTGLSVAELSRRSMVVEPLHAFLEADSFEVGRLAESSYPYDGPQPIDARIGNVVTGLALGLAELERLLRLQDREGRG